jgi:hypothetical protein
MLEGSTNGYSACTLYCVQVQFQVQVQVQVQVTSLSLLFLQVPDNYVLAAGAFFNLGPDPGGPKTRVFSTSHILRSTVRRHINV